MTVATVIGYDATHANIAHLPRGQAAGYSTGSGGVPWTAADWAAHPGAVQIDQSPVNTALDELADVLDYEDGAATRDDIVPWCRAALANYHSGARPGQRSPAVYFSQSRTTEVVNALIAGGIASGIGLAIANYSVDQDHATAAVANASGPFPVVWFQYTDAPGTYDIGVFSVPWLNSVSAARPPVPPGQWLDPAAWTWKEATLSGTGLDGRLHTFVLSKGTWQRIYQ